DPYVYPGTSVLKNVWDIRDLEELNRLEAVTATRRLIELANKQPLGKCDSLHLRAIHHHIFQDVYTWAGEFRTINIARSGQFYFAFPERIQPCLDTLFADLANENYLAGLGPADFCRRAGFYLGELNAIHPFREGNGRTQREIIRQLALRCGYWLS